MTTDHDNPVFRGFDPLSPTRLYRRNLPHWRQDGATYFVTFRLGDSIPRDVCLGWQEQDRVWLTANGIEGLLSESRCQALYEKLPEKARRGFEQRAGRRMHVELDRSHGSCLLRQPAAREVITHALKHFEGERWWTGDFVVMPNHVHGLFQPIESQNLEDTLGSIKGFVSTRLTKLGVKTGELWQSENYDRLVRDRTELLVWRRYIERNPGKAGLEASGYTYYRCDWLDDK